MEAVKRIYKGVSWQGTGRRWLAYVSVPADMRQPGGIKQFHVGSFPTELEAALAYNRAARELLGNRAQLNVLPGEAEQLDPDPPKPQEIARACRQIRKGWRAAERRRRAGAEVVMRYWDGAATVG